jgi:hypothetical protein
MLGNLGFGEPRFTGYERQDVVCKRHAPKDTRSGFAMVDWDYICGIGLPDGYGLSGGDHTRAHGALANLRVRVHEVRANPSAFSKYTVDFATLHVGEFINLDEKGSCREGIDELPF